MNEIEKLQQEVKDLRSEISSLRYELEGEDEHDYEDDDADRCYEDWEDQIAEERAERAFRCTCGAWQFNKEKTQVFHVADCCCGAE